MNKSEQINELAAALAKAQGKIKPASREGENPFFQRGGKSSTYATLAAVWDACREPLSENGLSVVQTINHELNMHNGQVEVGHAILETMLLHSSGQWISGSQVIKPVKDDPQGVKSAITYARRAGLEAIVGVAPEDDDGNAASGKPAVGTKAAAQEVASQKIAEGQAKLKQDMEARKAAEPPAPQRVFSDEEVINGTLVSISDTKYTKDKKTPFVLVTIGKDEITVWDKKIFQAPTDDEFSPLQALYEKEVSAIVKKKGQYLNLVAISEGNDDNKLPF